MTSKYAVDLTDKAKKQVIQWYQSNSRFALANADALLSEIRNHDRFGQDGFVFELTSFESKHGTPNTYGFGLVDYVFEEENND